MAEKEEIVEEMYFTRPSILKIARKAGVKSLSDDCYALLDTYMAMRIEQLVKQGISIHKVRGGKVLLPDDIQQALKLNGVFRTNGDELSFTKA